MADFTSDIVTKEQLALLSASAGGLTGFSTLGGAVTQQSPLALAVDVAAIAASTTTIAGTINTNLTAATTASFSAADQNLARIDIVVWTNAGAVAVREGTAAADPVPGTIVTTTDVELAQVKVNAGVTTITTADITDRRQLIVVENRALSALLGSDF